MHKTIVYCEGSNAGKSFFCRFLGLLNHICSHHQGPDYRFDFEFGMVKAPPECPILRELKVYQEILSKLEGF